MNSGSPSISNALPHKSGHSSPRSARHHHHPVRSPSDQCSPSTAPQPTSPLPESATKPSRRPLSGVNGDAPSDALNGHDDSEAETLRLSDQDVYEATKAKRRKAKDEMTEGSGPSSPSLTTRSEPVCSYPGSRASSIAVDATDKPDRKLNGTKAKENGVKNGSSRLPAHGKARSLTEADAKSRAHSADASGSPAKDGASRIRQALSAEPRKRKFSDGSSASKLERPRQKARLDGPSKERVSTPNTDKPKSASLPGSAASAGRQHRRSISTQSHAPTASSAPLRSRRDTHSTASGNFDESSSEPASPRPPPITLLGPPRSKASARALASPARAAIAMPHGKKTDRFGLTALARACERGNLSAVKSAYAQSPDELDFVDNAGYAPLQKAALEGHADIVEFLLEKGCRKDCQSKNQDTPLIDAVENCHVDVVRLLLEHGVNPHHQNDRGQRAIDLIDHGQDEAEEMEALLHKAMISYEGPGSDDEKVAEGPAPLSTKGERKDLLHKENTAKSLLEYAQRGDIEAVDYFLNMRVRPNVECCVAAARGGHETILNLLLVDVSDKDPDPASYEETPLLAAIGRGHKEVVQLLLDQEGFNPCRRTREGKMYWEVAEERHGPKWQQERDLLKERFERYRASHPGKGGKKKRAEAPAGQTHGRTDTSSRADPKAPKLTSPKLAVKPKIKAEKPDDAPRRRLLSAREMSLKDRRRRVVSSDGSSGDDEDDEVRAPAKNLGKRRKSSTAEKPPRKSKDKIDRLVPTKRPDKVDKQEKPEKSEKAVVRKRPLSTSPHVERRKRADPNTERVSDKFSDKAYSSDAEMKDMPPVPVREETPEAVREERRAAEKAEAERIQREKEEAEARRLEEERWREEEERLRKEEEARKRRERLESLPTALRFALQHGAKRPLTFTTGWWEDPDHPVEGMDANFLPILQWPLSQIDPDCPASRVDEKWMMSFQVVGLFGLPELCLEEYPGWEKREVPLEQRQLFLRGYCIDKLAHFYHFDPDDASNELDPVAKPIREAQAPVQQDTADFPMTNGVQLKIDTSVGLKDASIVAFKANERLDEYYNAIEDTKAKFMRMQPLYYVRYDDFLEELPQYPHLNGLKINCCKGPSIRPSEPPKWVEKLRKSSTPKAVTPKSANAVAISKPGTPKLNTPNEPVPPQEPTAPDISGSGITDNLPAQPPPTDKTTDQPEAMPTVTVADADVKVEDTDSPATNDGITGLSNPIKALVEGMGDDDVEMADG